MQARERGEAMKHCDIGFISLEMASHLRAGVPYRLAWEQSVRSAWGDDACGELAVEEWEGIEEGVLPPVLAQYARRWPRPQVAQLVRALCGGRWEWGAGA